MRLVKLKVLAVLICLMCIYYANAQSKNVLTIKNTGFELNGKPFEFTGVSFFNAIYNPAFNETGEIRRKWIQKFNHSGINVFRVWCQWDNDHGFVDAGKDKTMYMPDGTIKPEPLSNLLGLLKDADIENTVILLVFFSQESWHSNIRVGDEASNKAVTELTKVLKPYRNLIFQIWNEFDNRTLDYLKIIKDIDNERIVTNCPGFSGVLGSQEENNLLDYLSPHTTRIDNRHWEVANHEIEYLVKKYNKPVVDDEPARKGTPKFGGPKTPPLATDHILHIYNVWKAGGYVIYHHDMFQIGTDRGGSVPLNGIPAPGFSEYHDQVYNFLKEKDRYLKEIRK